MSSCRNASVRERRREVRCEAADARSVTRGEVLALRLARRAGIDAAGLSRSGPVVHRARRRDALITNVDDHLQNHGFLYGGNGQWRLAPAFDLNPFPDKDRESRTWLSPETGPIESLQMLLDNANYFGLGAPVAALEVLREVVSALSNWRVVAFEHEAALAAGNALGR